MLGWLAMAAAAPALAAHGAHPPLPFRMQAAPIGRTHHTPDLTLPQEVNFGPGPMVTDGMILHDSIAPNAMVGLGFANMSAKRRSADGRIGQRSGHSHRPAVTFVLKF